MNRFWMVKKGWEQICRQIRSMNGIQYIRNNRDEVGMGWRRRIRKIDT